MKSLLDEYQKNAKMNENISTIEQMQAFMERYPAFRSHSLNVSKHVAIMGELARLTDVCHLLDISALEQEISCSTDHSLHKQELFSKLTDNSIQPPDKLRLAILYVIKYESYNEISEIKTLLNSQGVDKAFLLDAILQYAGESRRAPGLFSQGSIMDKLGKTITSTVRGVENVYTQHAPLLQGIIDSIAKNKIKEQTYPALSSASGAPSRLTEAIIFIVGGATYEEAFRVAEFNNANPGLRIILGGSCVHNSQTFLEELGTAFGTGAR